MLNETFAGTLAGMFAGGRSPSIEVGVDASERLRGLLPAAGGVVVADGGVRACGYLDTLLDALGDAIELFVVPAGEPTTDSVDAATDAVRRRPGAAVVGVGGGTALDTAKQAAVVAAGTGSIEQYALCAAPFAGRRTIVAVPTTAGTGSEVTRTCIFTNSAGRKVWTWGGEMLPDVVLLDPRATVTMPTAVTVATGLDAFVHAIEAASGRRQQPMVVAPAAAAIGLIRTHLPAVVADPTDLAGRSAMQQAALLAGLAIDAGGTGIAHSIGHALGTLCGVPHGLAVSVGLLAALGWNVRGAPEAYAAVCEAVGISAALLAGRFDDLARDVGLGSVVAHRGPLACTASEISAWMVADENMPMFTNNACDATDHRDALAAATVDVWDRLR